jgi:ActR/RegA family two-component response regulator
MYNQGMEVDNRLFWDKVKQLITVHKTSQEKIADYIQVHRRTLKGRREPQKTHQI